MLAPMKYALCFFFLVAVWGSSTTTYHYTNDTLRGCCSELELFRLVLFRDHPTYGTCVGGALLDRCICSGWRVWSILRRRDGRPLVDIARCEDPIPMRSVDYLFLIEQPCVTAEGPTVETLLANMQTLVQRTQDNIIYHDVKVQYGFVVYNTRQNKVKYVYARDFSSDLPSELRSLLLSSVPSPECTFDSSGYRSVTSAVGVVKRSLKLVNWQSKFHFRVNLASRNKSVHLWHRPYSDLHILSVIDIDTINSTNSEDGEREWELEDFNVASDKVIVKLDSVPAYPLSIHMFFSTANTAAMSSLGMPGAAVRYSDCSHFKKAPTLKGLLAEKQGDSLQALLLSRGVEFQLHFLQDLKNRDCIHNISPALSTPLGIRPQFADKCLVGSPIGKDSSEDMYCSNLHGWTRRTGARSLNSDLFQDKVPLTDKYKSSHADIAMSASIHNLTGNAEVVPGVELSISRTSGCTGPKPVIRGKPRSVRWEHNKPFMRELIKGGEPVVMRGTVVETWPALNKWNMSYLVQKMGTDILELVKCTNSFITFDPDHRAPLKMNIPLSYTLANISTTDFFECVQSPMLCFDGYKGHYYFGQVPDPLKADISPDSLLYNTDRDRKAGKQFMWLSSAGMITHTHFDQDYNIFVQLVGRKRFTLWPPEQHEILYVFPRVHPMWHKSRVNYQDVDIAQFPAFPRARGIQVELGPGDMLYVPPYTWHYVETLSPSVSLSTWSHDYELYDHMNAIYRHDHKFDLLQNQKGELQTNKQPTNKKSAKKINSKNLAVLHLEGGVRIVYPQFQSGIMKQVVSCGWLSPVSEAAVPV